MSGKFQTHIPEPRWQRTVSIAVVLVIVTVEILFALKIL
jgi:hypothetical protein